MTMETVGIDGSDQWKPMDADISNDNIHYVHSNVSEWNSQ